MRTRHRIPSIFNLSMVDVLCWPWGASFCCGWSTCARRSRRRFRPGSRTSRSSPLATDRGPDRQVHRGTGRPGGVHLFEPTPCAGSSPRRKPRAAPPPHRSGEPPPITRRRAGRGRLGKDLPPFGRTRRWRKTSPPFGRTRRPPTRWRRRARPRRPGEETRRGRRPHRRPGRGAEGERCRDCRRRPASQRAGRQAQGRRGRAKEYRDKLAAEEALATGLQKEINKRLQPGGRRQGPGRAAPAKGGLERDLDRYKKDLDAARRSIAALEDDKKGLVVATAENGAADNRFAGIR